MMQILITRDDAAALEVAYKVAALHGSKSTPLIVGTIGHIDHGATTISKEDLTNELIAQMEKDLEQRRQVFKMEIPKVEYYNAVPRSKKRIDFIAKRRR